MTNLYEKERKYSIQLLNDVKYLLFVYIPTIIIWLSLSVGLFILGVFEIYMDDKTFGTWPYYIVLFISVLIFLEIHKYIRNEESCFHGKQLYNLLKLFDDNIVIVDGKEVVKGVNDENNDEEVITSGDNDKEEVNLEVFKEITDTTKRIIREITKNKELKVEKVNGEEVEEEEVNLEIFKERVKKMGADVMLSSLVIDDEKETN